ncbi:MAG TPA: hypothetical protein VF456_27690, partial [Vicinamibacterales bacterium]
MKIVKTFVIALLFSLAAVVHAQQEAKNWFFGARGALSFGPNPAPYTPGTPTMNTQEGSAVISDSTGNLLFYTDGLQIDGPTHAVITGGTGLLGGSSATQSAVIVPWPDGKCDKYFVFTVEEQENHDIQHLRYSVVQISSGVASVLSKNTLLQSYVSEKLIGIADPSGGFLVMAHGYDKSNTSNPVNSEFYAFHVGAGGITPGPVSTGFPHVTGPGGSSGVASSGQMAFSPDGSKIACAVNSAFVEIYDFDITTGKVMPGTGIKLNANQSFPNPQFQEYSPYGLAFGDNNTLYVSTISAPSRLYHIVINPLQVTLLKTGNGVAGVNYDIGQLQWGLDHKIYVARDGSQTISVIANPTGTALTCGYQDTGATLAAGATSRLGLPTIIQGPSPCSGVTINCPAGTTPT